MGTSLARTAALVAGALLILGCGGDGDDETTDRRDDVEAVTTTVSTTASTTAVTTTSTTAPPPVSSTTEAPATEPVTDPVGPQVCGVVTSTIGTPVTVEIIVGHVDCAFAEDLLSTYYVDPPTPPQGSGAFVTIGDWDCNSSSTQEPGRASTCHGPDDGLIVSIPADGGATDGSAEGSAPADPPATPAGEPGPYCSQIDPPTLAQIFPDGVYDEQLCRNYFGDGYDPGE